MAVFSRSGDRYRVTKGFSAFWVVAIVVMVLGVVALGGLAERTLGWGNLIVIGVLIPAVVRTYVVKRTALMLTPTEVLIDGQVAPWHMVGELVVVGPVTGRAIEIQARHRRRTDEIVARGTVPGSKYDPASLRAAFRMLAPSTATLSGWGLDAHVPMVGRMPDEDAARPATGVVRPGAAAPATGTSLDRPFGHGRWNEVKVALRRWEASRGRLFRPVATVVVVAVLVGATVWTVRQARQVEPVEEDFVGVYPRGSFPLVDEAEYVGEDEGRLIGPHFNLAIDHVAVRDSLSTADDAPELPDSGQHPRRMRAPDGHDLVVAYLGEPDVGGLGALDYFDDDGTLLVYEADHESDLEAWVDVGAGRRRLRTLPEAGAVVVASVPEGSDAHFALSDEGQWQSISLRTGRRQEAIEGFYTTASQGLDFEYSEPAQVFRRTGLLSVTTEDTTVELSVSETSREPWHPELGYATPGRAWLEVDWEAPMNSHFADLQLDGPTTIVVVDEAGHEITAAGSYGNPAVGQIGAELVFDVPDTFTTGTLRVRPVAGAGLPWGLYAWATTPPDANVALALSERPI